MMRINVRELNRQRVTEALARRFMAIPRKLEQTFSKRGISNKNLWDSYHNIHRGEKCFLLANGPSLANTDFDRLRDEITFGLNRIYLLEDKMKFTPAYYACVNDLVLEQFSEEIDSLKTVKFLGYNRHRLFKTDGSTLFINTKLSLTDRFSKNPVEGLYSGGTVTYVALQLIYYLGFEEVVIIGMDHNFVDKGIPNKTEIRTSEKDENHFHPDYFPKGVKWQLPDLLRSEMAYALAREAFESDNRKIIDCTVNGKCHVFEKGNLEDYV